MPSPRRPLSSTQRTGECRHTKLSLQGETMGTDADGTIPGMRGPCPSPNGDGPSMVGAMPGSSTMGYASPRQYARARERNMCPNSTNGQRQGQKQSSSYIKGGRGRPQAPSQPCCGAMLSRYTRVLDGRHSIPRIRGPRRTWQRYDYNQKAYH